MKLFSWFDLSINHFYVGKHAFVGIIHGIEDERSGYSCCIRQFLTYRPEFLDVGFLESERILYPFDDGIQYRIDILSCLSRDLDDL